MPKPRLTWFFDIAIRSHGVRREDGAVLWVEKGRMHEDILFQFASGLVQPFELAFSQQRGYYFPEGI